MERPTRPKRPARCHAQRFSSSEPGEARAGIKTRSRRRGERLSYEPRGTERPRDERALANSGANAGFKQGSDQGGRRPCEGDRVYQAVHPKGLWPGNHVLRAETSCPCPPQTLSLPGSSETTLSMLMELVVTPRGE